MKPIWCAKQSPCDFDENSSYCPHRECRQQLVQQNDAMHDAIMAYTSKQSMENFEALIRSLVPNG